MGLIYHHHPSGKHIVLEETERLIYIRSTKLLSHVGHLMQDVMFNSILNIVWVERNSAAIVYLIDVSTKINETVQSLILFVTLVKYLLTFAKKYSVRHVSRIQECLFISFLLSDLNTKEGKLHLAKQTIIQYSSAQRDAVTDKNKVTQIFSKEVSSKENLPSNISFVTAQGTKSSLNHFVTV